MQVQLADRSLLPGDVVKLADPNLSKQKGYVSDVDVIASVKVLAAGQIVKNIDCRELHPLQVKTPLFDVTTQGYRCFQNYAATHRQNSRPKVAMDCCQSNMIRHFECFIQKNCIWINFNQSFITNESFRSNGIEIKRIQAKFLFD